MISNLEMSDSDESSKRTIILSSTTTNISESNLGRFRQDPLKFLLNLSTESSAFYNGADWRGYENFIGSRILYPEYTTEIKKALLGSDRGILNADAVRNAIQQLSVNLDGQLRQKAQHKLWKQSMDVVNNMVAEMDSMRTLKFFAFFITNLLVRSKIRPNSSVPSRNSHCRARISRSPEVGPVCPREKMLVDLSSLSQEPYRRQSLT